jgi:hypothetical protein
MTKSLEAKGLTLEEVVEKHYEDVNKSVRKDHVKEIRGMDSEMLEKYKNRFSQEDFNLAKIIEASGNVAPLIAYQKRMKKEQKAK